MNDNQPYNPWKIGTDINKNVIILDRVGRILFSIGLPTSDYQGDPTDWVHVAS